jgi:sulfur carrier protein ThiS
MDEIIERILKRYDAEDLLEALDISSEELLDRFEDKFINRLQVFEAEVDEDEVEVEQDEY